MAGQIPRDFIDDLIARTDIVQLVDSRVRLKKAGKNYQACCPFHNEKSPSFTVSQEKQFYHCFGCGAHGTAISFLMEYDRLSFPDAIEELASLHGLEVPRDSKLDKGEAAKKRQQAENDYELMEQASRFFQKQLRDTNKAAETIEYLKSRGVSGEIAKDFQIGYAPDGWHDLMDALATNRQVSQQMLDLKLITENDNKRRYDFFRNRLMFPIRDRRGRVIGFGGRVLGEGTPKYLNSPETRIFHKGRELYGFYEAKQANRNLDRVLIVEGYMDVVALAQYDIRYAVASLGTSTTADHIQMLFRATNEVICCYDGDKAGRAAAWRALENALPFLKDGIAFKFLFLPDGEDPDTFVRKFGKEALEQKMQQATEFTQFIFDHLMADIDATTDSGKSRLLQQAQPLIEQVDSDFYRERLQEKLNHFLGRHTSPVQKTAQKPKQVAKPQALKVTPMRRAIALLIQNPELSKAVPLYEDLKDSKIPGLSLFIDLQRQALKYESLSTGQLLESRRDTPEYKSLAQLASFESNIEKQDIEKEFKETFCFILDNFVNGRISELLTKDKVAQLDSSERRELAMLLEERKRNKEN